MAHRSSLRSRVALAIGLLIGFYTIAIAIAGGLLFVLYAEMTYAHHFNLRLAGICVIGAFAIIKGILPRVDRFDPPGPRVSSTDHPRLFAAVSGVASATAQRMPVDVYLVADMNAFVTERGGVMGIGSRRVMGIGLPLLHALTVNEFRAVVAHEFGHFHGGDTKLGPWIYKTRVAILRTLESVNRHSSWLRKPFEWYGGAFSRVTLAVSRRQEFVADGLAARTCGARHIASALTTLERSGTAFAAYWQQEVITVLAHGFRPPVIDGFARFVTAPDISARLDEVLEKELADGVAGAYDTHPSLKERLAAIAAPQLDQSLSGDEPRAISLLENVAEVEARVIGSLAKPGTPPLAPIDWVEVPHRVLTAAWAELADASGPGLKGLAPTILPEIAARLGPEPNALVRQLGIVRHGAGAAEAAQAQAAAVLGAAVALALKERLDSNPTFITLTGQPGEPVVFHIGGDGPISVQPFMVLDRLMANELAASEWLAVCHKAGVADVDLGACVQRAVAACRSERAARLASA